MGLCFLLKLLLANHRLLQHDKWSRHELEQYQIKSLELLRRYAYTKSPFYKEFHRGLYDYPLNELPVLTKKELMRNFDKSVTNPQIKLNDIYSHIKTLHGDGKYLDKYRVSSTSGSTGLRGIFPFSEDEWVLASASYLRVSNWAGISAGPTKRLRVAVVGSSSPWHVSARVGETLNSWWIPTISLDSTHPASETVQKLNDFQPTCLMGYANSIRMLAEQQISGQLKISPKAIFCTSEVLTEDSRAKILKAFVVQPFNVYAATETAGFASECSQHKGLHLYEDLVITEVVDDNYKPVIDGEYGKKILVTVLFSRTLPLIRYEMTDSLKLESSPCTCGLPFRRIGDIQGRLEETLGFLDDFGNLRKIEPNVFHRIMELIPAAGWQIIQDTENSLRILILQPDEGYSESLLIEKMKLELNNENINPRIFVEIVGQLQYTATGKIVLIKSLVDHTLPAIMIQN